MKFELWGVPMNYRTLVLVAVAMVSTIASGCTCVSVYTATKKPSLKLGTVTPLRNVLSNSANKIRTLNVIFIHGVGDTLPGYAIGDQRCKRNASINKNAWLNPRVLKLINLRSEGKQRDTWITAGDIDVGTSTDRHQDMIHLRERTYLWTYTIRKSSGTLTLHVMLHAFEITWAPMTCWIKNTQLKYDSAGISPFGFLATGSVLPTCKIQPKRCSINEAPAPTPNPPPPRVLVNGMVKWQLLDRTLSDAVIYAGTYGEAIQRGVAAALCRIAHHDIRVVENNSGLTDKQCSWPTAKTMRNGRYIFVTHSLGGPILFDTLVGLQDTKGRHEKFPDAFTKYEVDRSAPIVDKMLKRTLGIYMMANQLSLMGLANIPLDAPVDQQAPYIESSTQGETRIGASTSTIPSHAYSLFTLLKQRAAATAPKEHGIPLNVISFNDTNDLLTWHIPAWYVEASSTKGADELHISDVFVRNAPRWLWLWEWPPSAHAGYLSSMTVWRVIWCGAKAHQILSCRN